MNGIEKALSSQNYFNLEQVDKLEFLFQSYVPQAAEELSEAQHGSGFELPPAPTTERFTKLFKKLEGMCNLMRAQKARLTRVQVDEGTSMIILFFQPLEGQAEKLERYNQLRASAEAVV
jgi:hypothetical protein